MQLQELILQKNIIIQSSIKVDTNIKLLSRTNVQFASREEIINKLEAKPLLFFDTETSVIPTWECLEQSNLDWLAIHNPTEYAAAKRDLTKEKSTGVLVLACFFDGETYYILEGPNLNLNLNNKIVVAYNTKFDIKVLLKAGIDWANIETTKWCDLMIANQLIYNDPKDPTHKKHKLTNACDRIGFERISDKEENQTSFILGQDISAEQLLYLLEDVACLVPMYKRCIEMLTAFKLQQVFGMECQLLPILAYTEYKGVAFDSKGCIDNILRWEKELVAQEKELLSTYLELGHGFGLRALIPATTKKKSDLINFGSPTQIKAIFEWANLTFHTTIPTVDKKNEAKEIVTATSTGEIALQEWLTKNEFQAPPALVKFVELILNYRAKNKLISQYGYGLLYNVVKGNRIHTNYGQCFTNTGRLNSFGPNMQNIPRDNTIRNLFVPDDNYVFFDWDFDGQEIKIAANYSKDELLLAAALTGADIHSTMASLSFSIIFGQQITVENDKNKYVEVISPLNGKTYKYNMATELRQHHKNCLFAIN